VNVKHQATASGAEGALKSVKKPSWSVLLGAAFIMATSATGPGFFDPDCGIYRGTGGKFRLCHPGPGCPCYWYPVDVWRIITLFKKENNLKLCAAGAIILADLVVLNRLTPDILNPR
jgi:hypothetical protein